jgi:hypothetical protein
MTTAVYIHTLQTVALTWDGTFIQCDGPDCAASERLPASLLEQSGRRHDDWLIGRAWATDAGRHYCPEHW